MTDHRSHPDDELPAKDEKLQSRSAAARLFDVRRVIGLLFVIYGVIVTLLGIFDSEEELATAEGVRINLWMGIGMLILGLLFLLWLRLNPPRAPTEDDLPQSDERPPPH